MAMAEKRNPLSKEPLAKVVSGDFLPHCGAVLSCKMEPPFTSFQLKIALEVGLQLIHPDFCKWLKV